MTKKTLLVSVTPITEWKRKKSVSQQIAYLVEDNLIKKVFNASKKVLNKGVEKIVFILPVSYVFTFRAVYFWHQHLFF